MFSRRSVIAAGAAGTALAAPGALARPAARRQHGLKPPDLGFLRATPLADAERLRRFMAADGLDALIVTHPANVFYLTNHWPQLDRMGMEGAGIAIFTRDPARPIGLVMHAFLYYYTHSPESDFADRLVFTYTNPADPAAPDTGLEPAASPARTMRVADPALITPLDAHRTALFAKAQANSAEASWALKKAVAALKLEGASVGVDDPALEAALRLRGFSGAVRPGEDTIRRARMAKSAAELRLMRLAAQNNMEAAMAAARQARALGTTRQLRAAFFAEAALRGNSGHFMVIAGTSSEALDQELTEGMALSIDCVSTCRFYHGDFARTIFVGEPLKQVRTAAKAVANAWYEIREALRPGMRFADVSRIGRESLKKQGADISVSFTPHSVGLFHTDHPQPSLIAPRRVAELKLEENMILSVDCPVFVAGLGGSIHLEDLMLIRDGRAEAIHAVPDPVIMV